MTECDFVKNLYKNTHEKLIYYHEQDCNQSDSIVCSIATVNLYSIKVKWTGRLLVTSVASVRLEEGPETPSPSPPFKYVISIVVC